MEITCPKCAATIPADHVNLDRMIAKCTRCNAVFDFSDQIDGPAGGSGGYLKRPIVDLPKGFTLAGQGIELAIIRRWFGPAALFLIPFALFWNGFLCVWYSIAISAGQVIMMVFPILHVAVGVGVGYTALAMVLNQTAIRVSPGLIDVRHGPLPWFGNRQIDPSSLAQLYVAEKVSRGRRSASVTYELRARTRLDRDEPVVEGLERAEQALYLEQEIERYLAIKDSPVRGEYRGV